MLKEQPEEIVSEMGNLTGTRQKDTLNENPFLRWVLVDNGLIIFYTHLIAGNFMRRQLLAPSNLGKIAFIKIRMNGIR